MPFSKEDIELYKKFQKSPIYFVEKMFGLVPQPIKEEYKDIAAQSELCDYKVEWFEPFVFGEQFTWQQFVILLAVEQAMAKKSKRRISIASGHGVGKSSVLSWLLLWFLKEQKK